MVVWLWWCGCGGVVVVVWLWWCGWRSFHETPNSLKKAFLEKINPLTKKTQKNPIHPPTEKIPNLPKNPTHQNNSRKNSTHQLGRSCRQVAWKQYSLSSSWWTACCRAGRAPDPQWTWQTRFCRHKPISTSPLCRC